MTNGLRTAPTPMASRCGCRSSTSSPRRCRPRPSRRDSCQYRVMSAFERSILGGVAVAPGAGREERQTIVQDGSELEIAGSGCMSFPVG
jgi:hypothetical protein